MKTSGDNKGEGVVEKVYKAIGFRCEFVDGISIKADYRESRPNRSWNSYHQAHTLVWLSL